MILDKLKCIEKHFLKIYCDEINENLNETQ